MDCTNCGAVVSPGSTTCPSCGTPQNVSPSPGKIHTPNPRGFCGSCGTPLIAKYSPCPNCGHVKTTYNPQPNPGNPNPQPNPGYPNPPQHPQQQGGLYKNPTTALILSIVLGILGIEGIGQIYVGKVGRGVTILVAGFAFWIIGWVTFPWGTPLLIGLFVLFIWQIYDTNKLVKQYNNYVSQNGRAPWSF